MMSNLQNEFAVISVNLSNEIWLPIIKSSYFRKLVRKPKK
jgi:hypothetical protein